MPSASRSILPMFASRGFQGEIATARTSLKGFTLIEMVAVVSIILIMLGMGVQGIAYSLKRNSLSGGPTILASAIEGLASAATKASASGQIYGLSICRNTDKIGASDVDVRKQFFLIPWVCTPNDTGVLGSISVFTEPAQLRAIMTVSDDLYHDHDGVAKLLLPATACVGSYFSYVKTINFTQAKIGSTSTALTNNDWIHIAFEPGSSMVHATYDTATAPYIGTWPSLTQAPFSSLFPATATGNFHRSGALPAVTTPPDPIGEVLNARSGSGWTTASSVSTAAQFFALPMAPIELNLHNLTGSNNRKVHRLMIYGSGFTEVQRVRD